MTMLPVSAYRNGVHIVEVATLRLVVAIAERDQIHAAGQDDVVGAGQSIGFFDCRSQATHPGTRRTKAVTGSRVACIERAVNRECRRGSRTADEKAILHRQQDQTGCRAAPA